MKKFFTLLMLICCLGMFTISNVGCGGSDTPSGEGDGSDEVGGTIGPDAPVDP